MKSETLAKLTLVTTILPKVSVDGVAKVGLMQSNGLSARVIALVKERRTFPTLAQNLTIDYLTRSEIFSRLRYQKYVDSYDPKDSGFLIAHNVPGAVVANRLGRKFNIPFLVYMHDARFSEIPGTRPRFDKEEIRRSLESAKSILTNSRKTLTELEELYGVKGSPLYPGCISSDDIDHDKVNDILCVHSIAKGRNFEILLKLMERNKERNLIIAGGKRYTWQEVYFRFKSRLGNRVRFYFNPSESELASLYSRSRLVVHPGIENFGLSPLEAAGQGTPSIVTRGSGILEVLREGSETIAFSDGDLDELDSALKSCSDSMLKDLGTKAHRRVQDFGWFAHVEALRKEIER